MKIVNRIEWFTKQDDKNIKAKTIWENLAEAKKNIHKKFLDQYKTKCFQMARSILHVIQNL